MTKPPTHVRIELILEREELEALFESVYTTSLMVRMGIADPSVPDKIALKVLHSASENGWTPPKLSR